MYYYDSALILFVINQKIVTIVNKKNSNFNLIFCFNITHNT